MTTIAKRHVLAAKTVVGRMPEILEKRGLEARLKDWVLTNHRNNVWLFGVLDVGQAERLERYTTDSVLHHISTCCDGAPVYLSNTNGLRYAFLLSTKPTLPSRCNFPGCARDVLRLGVGAAGQALAVRWDDLGHLLVAGETRMGKSNLLRLIVHQALNDGGRLLLSDLSQTSFPMLVGNDALLAPIATTPEDAHGIIAKALAECDRRAALFQNTDGYPDKLSEYNAVGGDPLPRVLVILDEYNATAVANGGHRGQFAQDVAALCWQGLKFGVHVIVAATDFEKRIVGRMRDQTSAICFRVRSKELARGVGCAGADEIPATRKGRAISERWGIFQAYHFDKAMMGSGQADILTDQEQALVTWARASNDGYLTLADIEERTDLSQYKARQLASDWERRGWLEKDAEQNNKRCVTPLLGGLVDNLQTPQTSTNA